MESLRAADRCEASGLIRAARQAGDLPVQVVNAGRPDQSDAT
jgi:hypothetical protein